MSIVKLEKISKSYGDKQILLDFDLEIKQGEFVSIMGKSGSGKSTLLNIIGLLDVPTSGVIKVAKYINPMITSKEGVHILRKEISYLFQNYALIENISVRENLKFSTRFMRLNKKQEEQYMKNALKEVELEDKLDCKVYQLSGGEQQRVALSKCIIKPSNIILADEPTGSVDEENRNKIMEVLEKLNKRGKTIIIVTHDKEVEKCALRNIYL